jgi:hypothetical protein
MGFIVFKSRRHRGGTTAKAYFRSQSRFDATSSSVGVLSTLDLRMQKAVETDIVDYPDLPVNRTLKASNEMEYSSLLLYMYLEY